MIKTFRFATVVLLVFWMGLIFYFSAQTAVHSSAASGKVISFFWKIFFSDFEAIPVYNRQIMIENYQFIVRKAAHFLIYFFLGIFSFLAIVSYQNLSYRLRVFISMLFCLLYAASDEFHQLFVPGRGPQLRDILLDCCGAFLAVLLTGIIIRTINPLYQRVKYCGKTK